MNENQQKLPDGWRWVKLGDVCKILNGSTPNSTIEEYWNGDIVWITPTDLGRLKSPLIINSSRLITKDGFDSCNTEFVPIGSVVMSSRAPIGHVGIAKVALCTNQGCKSFVPSNEVDTDFLYFYIKQSVPMLKSLGNGTTFQEISKSQLSIFEIPLPPLAEQKRIAAILNEQMAAVEEARKAAEAQLEAAEELPKAYLKEVFESEEALAWEKKRLGNVCDFIGGMQPPKSVFRYEPLPNYVRLVQIQDFRRNDVAVYIPQEEAKRTFEKTDVMIGRYGPPLFQILKGLSGAYNVALIKTLPKNELTQDFLYYLLQEPNIQEAVIEQSQRTAGQSGLQKEFLENFIVKIPTIGEQNRLAAYLTEKLGECDRLKQTIREQLKAINQLPAALLSRAFNGEV